MKFRLQFEMDNAAFDNNPEMETSDILLKVAGSILQGSTMGTISDSNGSKIGSYEIDCD